jgi:hypothetical protein
MKYTILHPYNIDIKEESFEYAIKKFILLNSDNDLKYMIIKDIYNKHKYVDILYDENNNKKFKIKSYTIDPINHDNLVKPIFIKFKTI